LEQVNEIIPMKCAIAHLRRCALGAVLAHLIAFAPVARAQEPSQPPPQQQTWDAHRLNMMIRNAIVALNQANITGNYTVLRDLGTPAFQRTNDAARLAIAFAELRAKSADFSPVFFINPTLVQQPSMDRNGVLRMTGFFPTNPQRIVFDVSYQQADGKWGLAALTVDIQPNPEEADVLKSALSAAAAAVNSPQKAPENRKAGSSKSPGTAKNNKGAHNTVETKPAKEEKVSRPASLPAVPAAH
jgi:hypothetical protein